MLSRLYPGGNQRLDGDNAASTRVALCWLMIKVSRSRTSSRRPCGLFLQRQDIRPDLLQGPHRLRFVEVTVEADLVADLHAVEPGTTRRPRRAESRGGGRLRSRPPPAAGICSVSRSSVSGSYSTTAGLASIVVSNRPRSGSASVPRLCILPDDGRGVLVPRTVLP